MPTFYVESAQIKAARYVSGSAIGADGHPITEGVTVTLERGVVRVDLPALLHSRFILEVDWKGGGTSRLPLSRGAS